MKKIIQGLVVSFAGIILPALGNRPMLAAPQLWVLVVVGLIAHVFQPDYKPLDKTAPAEDRGTAQQILWSCGLLQVAAVVEAAYLRYPASMQWDWIATVSLILMVLGLILRSWAVLTLGRFFTWHVSVQSGQYVIQNGPYRFIRHPSYTGALLIYLSGPIFLHAYWTTLLAIAVLPIAFIRRIHLEETLLQRRLGEEYLRYCQRVKALVPGVW